MTWINSRDSFRLVSQTTCIVLFASKRHALNTRNVIVDWRSDDEDPAGGIARCLPSTRNPT
jgi:hypothetical protein